MPSHRMRNGHDDQRTEPSTLTKTRRNGSSASLGQNLKGPTNTPSIAVQQITTDVGANVGILGDIMGIVRRLILVLLDQLVFVRFISTTRLSAHPPS